MDKIIVVGVFITLLIIGFVRISFEAKDIMEKANFANEFVRKLGQYLNSFGKDAQTYSWLIHRSPKFQDDMGIYGLASYKPPFSNDLISNYSIIIRMIPEIRKEFNYSVTGDQRAVREIVAYIQESILRYQGNLTDNLNIIQKRRKNPLFWMREGISWVVLLPFYIFNIFGLVDKATINRISNNFLFKIFSSIAAILEVLGTIMTIVLGWNSFLQSLKIILP